eukprot:TRINITY_DN11607_c0_g1_i1.p1 TRINITY_DN11607_c0_g1~~TRINITY_DN11607_c0_g1_i1.p1  ORF type:complete len:202 (+),score=45.81 TRINITY_DN11607_c0_g1_i1:208-813(+)
MIDYATKTYAATTRNVAFQCVDLEKELPPTSDPFDVAISFNVIHWIRKHQDFLDGLSNTISPGGKIHLLGHGKGSIQDILKVVEEMMQWEKYRDFFVGFQNPLNLFSVEEYADMLSRAGFTPVRIELHDKDVPHQGRAELRSRFHGGWRPWLNQLPSEEMRHQFSDEFIELYLQKHGESPEGIVFSKSMILEIEAVRNTNS